MATSSRFDSTQYAAVRQSLRRMPPLSPPLPKATNNTIQLKSPPETTTETDHHLSMPHLGDFLRGKSIKNLKLNMGRKHQHNHHKSKSGDGGEEISDLSGGSSSVASPQASNHNVFHNSSSSEADIFEHQHHGAAATTNLFAQHHFLPPSNNNYNEFDQQYEELPGTRSYAPSTLAPSMSCAQHHFAGGGGGTVGSGHRYGISKTKHSPLPSTETGGNHSQHHYLPSNKKNELEEQYEELPGTRSYAPSTNYAQHHFASADHRHHANGNRCNESNNMMDAEVSHSVQDDATFDYNYAKRSTTKTFDYDYGCDMGRRSRNHHVSFKEQHDTQPQRLTTLQQHVARKQKPTKEVVDSATENIKQPEHEEGRIDEPSERNQPCQYPNTNPDDYKRDSLVDDILSSAKNMDQALEVLKVPEQKSPQHTNERSSIVSQLAIKPSERYATRRSSAGDNTSSMDATLVEDIIRGAQDPEGQRISAVLKLKEMGLIKKSRRKHHLPPWIEDVLNAPLDTIDPEVLKELVATTLVADRQRRSSRDDDDDTTISSTPDDTYNQFIRCLSSESSSTEELSPDDFDQKMPAQQNIECLDVDPRNHPLQDHSVAQYKHDKGHQRQKKWSSMSGKEHMPGQRIESLGDRITQSLQYHNLAHYEHDEVHQKKKKRPSMTQDLNIPGQRNERLDVDPRTQPLLDHELALYNKHGEGRQKEAKWSLMPEVEKMPAQNREPNKSDANQMHPSCNHIVHQKHDEGLVKVSGPRATDQKMPAKERERFKSDSGEKQPSYAHAVQQNHGEGGEIVSVLSDADQNMPEHTSKYLTSGVDDHLQTSQDLAIQEKHDECHQKIKKSPSATIHLDNRGPIPPTSDDFLGSSLTLLVEELPCVSLVEEEPLIIDGPHRESIVQDENSLAGEPLQVANVEHESLVEELRRISKWEDEDSTLEEPHRVSTVELDDRGPIPDVDIIDCALSFSSCNKDGGVKSSIPGLKNSTETPKSRKEIVHALCGDESQSAGPEELPSKSIEGDSAISSSSGAGKESHTTTTESEPTISQSSSSPTCRNHPLPTSLSPNTTSPQSSQNQSSSYYTWRQQSMIDYPSDEDPPVQDAPPPPPLPRMSTSFSSFDDDQSNTSSLTKPSVGFLTIMRQKHDVQATTMKMRQEVLESLTAKEQIEDSKTNILHPICI